MELPQAPPVIVVLPPCKFKTAVVGLSMNILFNTASISLPQPDIYMNVEKQIQDYIDSQPEPKRADMQELHKLIRRISPKAKLWFEIGTNSEGKAVSNPNIGYGFHTMKYANGKTRDYFQLSISANTTGISLYIIGIKDKTYLAQTFGNELGKASVTGYCIKFKALKDINPDVLKKVIQYGFEVQNEKAD
jgi:hypothetical protein